MREVYVKEKCLMVETEEISANVCTDGRFWTSVEEGEFRVHRLRDGLYDFVSLLFKQGYEVERVEEDWRFVAKSLPEFKVWLGKNFSFTVYESHWAEVVYRDKSFRFLFQDDEFSIEKDGLRLYERIDREMVSEYVERLIVENRITAPADKIEAVVDGDVLKFFTREGDLILGLSPWEAKFYFKFLKTKMLDAQKILDWIYKVFKNNKPEIEEEKWVYTATVGNLSCDVHKVLRQIVGVNYVADGIRLYNNWGKLGFIKDITIAEKEIFAYGAVDEETKKSYYEKIVNALEVQMFAQEK